ncbi:negative cofactor 2 transcription regulator complex subunit BUR6 [Aspergillus mulundensis]|uniref:NCT transcriptional regulatory complex subunit A n=1 Tax=Aspergillus mulundensis TaxID=1810919 RepID=A0A3D8SVI0_9EURO|nr:putative CCAAT-box-binding transcription factor [Aspergillus mulundensis]RDW90274.1 putative CCAAT-box-binding transcription factor [Aspergillus mulundensis]
MTEQDNSYRPRSPDLSTFQPTIPSPVYQFASPVAHRASYDASPFFTPHYQHPSVASARTSQPYIPPYLDHSFDSDMARRSSRLARAVEVAPAPKYEEPQYDEPVFEEPVYHEPAMPERSPEPVEPPKLDPAAGIEVKTKFPVARIKRIMQADEDVGKVAQVTPIAVSKALELFMISLVTKAAKEAKDRNSKRVTASHLKQAVAKDEVLDFLADIIAKVPDQPAGRKHEDDGSDQNEQPKRKRGGRRPKDDSD